MQRRQFLKTTGLAAAGMLLSRPIASAASDKRPLNFIVIMADALGATALGCTNGVPSLAEVKRFVKENQVKIILNPDTN